MFPFEHHILCLGSRGNPKNISATIIVSVCPLPPFSCRERVNKRRVKDIVKEFTLLCRGLHGTEYAAEYWNSTLELSSNRDLCPQRKTAGCHSSHKPCQWRISWNDCNDNPPRRRTRHETIPAQTCHRINGQTRKIPPVASRRLPSLPWFIFSVPRSIVSRSLLFPLI